MTLEEYILFIELQEKAKTRAYEIKDLSTYLYGGEFASINKLIVDGNLLGFETEIGDSGCYYTDSRFPSVKEFTCPIEELPGIIQAKEAAARQKEEEARAKSKADAEAYKQKQELKLLEELKAKYESRS